MLFEGLAGNEVLIRAVQLADTRSLWQGKDNNWAQHGTACMAVYPARLPRAQLDTQTCRHAKATQ